MNLVSVILPVRNGANFIREAIDSVLAQTYPHFELVIVDASDDSTPQIVASYNDARISYHRQRSKGSVNGYNEALDHYISGEYVTFIHHDDIMLPEKLYKHVRTMQRYQDVDCTYNDIEFVDERLVPLRLRGHEDFYHRTDDMRPVMMIGYGVSNLGMNIVIKRDFIEKHKLRYSLQTPTCCDHEMTFQLIDAGCNFKHVPGVLLHYRVHDQNYSADRDIVNRENLLIYARYSDQQLRELVEKTNFSDMERTVLLARLYYRLEQKEKGTALLETFCASHEDAWAYFYLGMGYYRFYADFARAETCLQKGSMLLPNSPEFYNNLGCVRVQQGRSDEPETAAFFARALALLPGYYEAQYNLDHQTTKKPFNPIITDREIENVQHFSVVWKDAEARREQSGSLEPAGV